MHLSTPQSVFISYAHEDALDCQVLAKHFELLVQQKLILLWHDHNLEPGDLWEPVIKQQLEGADIVIFLVSADFISSTFIRQIELQVTLDRHKQDKAVQVFPVLLNFCFYEPHILSTFQFLPINEHREIQPVKSWEFPDQAWTQVVEAVYRYVKGA